MTYDSNFNVKVYLNGILVSTGTSVNPLGFYGQVHIGHYLNWGNHYFQGRIDEVLVWNRPLSPEEVTRVFSGEHPVQDSTPPSTPQGLTVGNVTENQLSLFWSPSSDIESGVAYYNIYRNNETLKIGQINTPSYVNGGLTPGHTYTYEVSAVNGVGLESARSLPVSATTLADTTAPVISNLTISSITSTSATITWNTNEPSTSGVDYGTSAYDLSSESLDMTTNHSITLTNLNPGMLYHFRVRSSDIAGNTAFGEDSTITTLSLPPIPGGIPGGPILIISRASNPFSQFYAEILRTEGFNEFNLLDISVITATVLRDYDIVLLGEMPLNPDQVAMFGDWVNAGGNLIAMRPDKLLAGLLGLVDLASTLSNGYMLTDTSKEPGHGITASTVQYHGTADRYNLNGASSIASLYSDSSTPLSNPAVSLRSVGTNGGKAAAFTFDLARSIVYTRQGNPAWVGQKRTGATVHPVGSVDLFYGAAAFDPQVDWVNREKIAIPQADEQQRLLANLILHMNLEKRPLPRFWYFPRGKKAVVIMTGDDHEGSGTSARLNAYLGYSPSGCVVDNWECVRSSSYLFPRSTTLTDAQAVAYTMQGFEIALHVDTGCNNWTPTSLEYYYSNQLATFSSAYPGIPASSTGRTHCVAWSDWATQPKVQLRHGIRLDTNYYYWPDFWVGNRPGFFTGSGLPMRFADLDGTLIDVYQATTQMTDQSGQTYPFTIDSLLDKALGAEGYYGAFTTNIHNDSSISDPIANAIVNSAISRSVPVVSARQMLQWLDSRGSSSFGSVQWDGNVLSFNVSVTSGANGLEVMIPAQIGSKSVVGLTCGGAPLPYRREVVKGVDYAIFASMNSNFQAVFGLDTDPPIISNVSVGSITFSSSVIGWSTNEPADSLVEYGVVSGVYPNSSALIPDLDSSHSIPLSGLSSATKYFFRIHSRDGGETRVFRKNTPSRPPSTGCRAV